MARISGVDLPNDKRVEIGLTYIYGIGRTTATQIVEATEMCIRDRRQAAEESACRCHLPFLLWRVCSVPWARRLYGKMCIRDRDSPCID